MKKWVRHMYQPALPLGENGQRVTGSKEHIALSREAATEGMVLLKNENHALPLTKGRRIALFGKASVDYVKGGGGSGNVYTGYVPNFCEAMEMKESEGKVKVYLPLHDFYRENVQKQYEEGVLNGYTKEPILPNELLRDATSEAETAIISICRFSTEGDDRNADPSGGDFYLSKEEKRLVEEVCAHFSDVIVVLNVGGMIDTSWFYDNEKIRAVLLSWQGGKEGALAEADILCGDVSPSGKLTDTFASSFADYPSSKGFHKSEKYVEYTEDVFVGYRYFESHEDTKKKVNYPFGFGLSYTDFSIRIVGCEETKADSEISLTVAVKNTGAVSGKEVVEIYVAPPEKSVERPGLELKDFYKTKLLSPGEEEIHVFNLHANDWTYFDEDKNAFVLSSGEYTIFAGNSIRSIEVAYTYKCDEEQVFPIPEKIPYPTASFEEHIKENPEDLSDWPSNTGELPEHILPNRDGDKEAAGRPDFSEVAEGKVSLEDFLHKLTDDELITLLGGTPNKGVANTKGFGGLHYLGIPSVMTADGPAGLRLRDYLGIPTTAWPVATLLASTWNPDLLYRIGKAGAREVKENNLGIWLTPAVNIHRSPLCGRNFEYYSEDPLLAGKMAAAMIQGIQSEHIAASVKHFCANNKETNRKDSDSRVSMRALREIYLKPFEIAVKEGKVWTVMTSYNIVNGHYPSETRLLLWDILRNEWGFDGLTMSDWNNHADPIKEALAGNNVRMPYGNPKRLKKAMEKGILTREDLILNVRKLLELFLKLE